MECKLCNKKLESINHVLFECIPAQDILQTVNFPSATSPARNLGEKMKLALKIMSDTTVPENMRRTALEEATIWTGIDKSSEPRVAQLSSLEVYHRWHPPTFGIVKFQPNVREALLDGPPGFPLMFLELSRQDRKMAMMYISHSNETKRLPRIERVKQGIAETQEEAATRLPKITRDLDKGKGHVFDFSEPSGKRLQISSCDHVSSVHNNDRRDSDTESASSSLPGPTFSAPALVSTGFRLGPSSEGRVTGNQSMVKSQRRRPNSWKRKALTKPGNVMLGVFKAPKTNDVV
ncbi:hypothetical protein F2Q70_00021477 [Brassica cretica]|uniref:Reverse transcriptase zinc-binding domain-containing protein n=2 Tax=Brassica cretica TaxID=69181 RepID=A0A8S9HFL4_BRACR|nr:hypothetical protein F2Q70_00021477 [Brassica cretica]KAF2556833.1 hypothetical protein F2Q68_00015027 [Brassica cretica]KAF3609493.1 hypothetical protein DY000_02047768 [Brassica cretica]